MSEDNNVGKVSKRLREKRFDAKYQHTKNSYKTKYDGEMWNTGDNQFLALSKERFNTYDSRARRYSYNFINLTFFGYNYVFWTHEKEKKIVKVGQEVRLRPELAIRLHKFLTEKPTSETFLIPVFRGNYHLSFEKRSLFGEAELKWRFFNNKKEWDETLFLPRSKRKRERKDLKLEETRRKLWFTDDQSDKLVAYLETEISTYAQLPAEALLPA